MFGDLFKGIGEGVGGVFRGIGEGVGSVFTGVGNLFGGILHGSSQQDSRDYLYARTQADQNTYLREQNYALMDALQHNRHACCW